MICESSSHSWLRLHALRVDSCSAGDSAEVWMITRACPSFPGCSRAARPRLLRRSSSIVTCWRTSSKLFCRCGCFSSTLIDLPALVGLERLFQDLGGLRGEDRLALISFASPMPGTEEPLTHIALRSCRRWLSCSHPADDCFASSAKSSPSLSAFSNALALLLIAHANVADLRLAGSTYWSLLAV